MNRLAESSLWPATEVKLRPIGDIKPSPRNVRLHSERQIDQIRQSLRDYGWTTPVLVDEDGQLIAGHGRLEAAKREGIAEVPVAVAAGWTEAQRRAYALADNKIALNSTWDEAALGIELGELSGLGVDLGTLGFDGSEIASLCGTGGHAGLTDPDEAPALPDNPIATRGDLWVLGRHRLLCGSSTMRADVEKVLGGAKPRLMVTDPPYGVNYDPTWRERVGLSGAGAAKGKVSNDDRADWSEAWRLFPGAIAYVWHGGLHAGVVERSLQGCRFNIRAQIIWVKHRPVVGRGAYHWQHEPAWYGVREGESDDWRFVHEHEVATYAVAEGDKADWSGSRKQSTVWFIEHGKSATGHGTQKPVECMKRPMINNSAEGSAVYEPFSGSGTTIIAAEISARSCHAIEIDPLYVDVAVRRWQEFTGQNATLEGDGRTFEEIAAERARAAA